MKVAVFTCITGGYDGLRPPHRVEDGLDYFCFHDGSVTPCAPWQGLPIHDRPADAAAANRWVKMLPERQPALAGYAASLYIDGSMEIVGDLMPFIEQRLQMPAPVHMYEHPFRDCVYDESLACAKFGLDSILRIGRQARAMRAAGFPEHAGLFEAGVILRKHEPRTRSLMEAWWRAYLEGARRDQLSLPFVAWRAGVEVANLGPSDPRFAHRLFKLHAHGAKRTPLRTSLRSRFNRLLLAMLGTDALLGKPR